MSKEVILTDEQDRPTGTAEKLKAHREGLLHRAFSVFLFDENGQILLQKRAAGKYHSGGLWSNSCCSHQYRNETFEEAVHRSIAVELGIPEAAQRGRLKEAGTFLYFSDLGEMKEHEIDHVMCYEVPPDEVSLLRPDPEEAEEIRWVRPEEIRDRLAEKPDIFSSWFSRAFEMAVSEKKKYYCYILRCRDGSLYTGFTTDPVRREQEHNRGTGAKYTRSRRPCHLVYTECFDTKQEAMAREYYIKHYMTKQMKEELVLKDIKD